MPSDPRLGTPEEVFAHVTSMLDRIGHELLLFLFDDVADESTCRLVYSSHDVSPITHLPYDDRVIGETMYDAFPPTRDAEICKFHQKALVTRQPVVMPLVRYSDKRVPERVYQQTIYPIGERLVGVWVADVTALEQAEAEKVVAMERLDVQARELERSNRELEEFAYVASHDLKAPLRDISNLASWITEDAVDVLPEPSRKHLSRLVDRVKRMQSLLDDLLEYSRAGRVSEDVEQLDISALIQTAVELNNAPATFHLALPDDVPAIRGARAPVLRVFMNLIGNAIKHHDRADGRITVTWQDDDERLAFAVADDGPGIPPEFHERVFRLFTTLRPRDEVEGSGMGLAVVKKLVESHGGHLTVESPTRDDGRGATFRFSWPKTWTRQQAAHRR